MGPYAARLRFESRYPPTRVLSSSYKCTFWAPVWSTFPSVSLEKSYTNNGIHPTVSDSSYAQKTGESHIESSLPKLDVGCLVLGCFKLFF